jgi:arylsulfatase A
MNSKNPNTSRRDFLKASTAVAAGAIMSQAWQGQAAGAAPIAQASQADAKPNIIFIMCDDLGFGDVQCNNPKRGKIATPNIDRLAAGGMTFTDCHGVASLCTPARYGVLTGRYTWRTRLQGGNVSGYDRPLISEDRVTVASLLKQQGYATGCVGKWHVGWNWAPVTDAPIRAPKNPPKAGTRLDRAAQQALDNVDYRKPISHGPLDRGFDHFFGLSASLDMAPQVFVEDNQPIAEPTLIRSNFRNNKMLAPADFDDSKVVPLLVQKALKFISDRAPGSKNGKPFFLYLPLSSPHTPLVPSSQFAGRSDLGVYGDYVMETDWALGEVMNALDSSGISENTLVFFTSDHGPPNYIGIEALNAKGHYPAADLRGYKTDVFDGGHRVPFFASWPAKIKAGSVCDALSCTTGLMATCSDILKIPLPEGAGPDSASLLPSLLGKQDDPAKPALLVNQSASGRFAFRQGQYKLAFCAGSGGQSKPHDDQALAAGLPPLQLYDMRADIGEQHNLLLKSANAGFDTAALVEQMTQQIQEIIDRGRSTPGPALANDAQIHLRKDGVQPAKA